MTEGFVNARVLSERCSLVAKILEPFVYFADIWQKWDKIFKRGPFKKITRVTVLKKHADEFSPSPITQTLCQKEFPVSPRQGHIALVWLAKFMSPVSI